MRTMVPLVRVPVPAFESVVGSMDARAMGIMINRIAPRILTWMNQRENSTEILLRFIELAIYSQSL